MWIDLHIHSSYSDDGDWLPEDIIKECFRRGVKVLAIADHNTTKGVISAQEYLEMHREIDIQLVPSIEIDCCYHSINLHILGYMIDPRNKLFLELESNVLEMEQAASAKRVELVEKVFKEKMDLDKLYNMAYNGVITGEVIAEELLTNDKFLNHELLKPYRKGGHRSDNPYVNFYWDFCAQGKEAYVPMHYISLDSAVAIIRKAGGIPILAHPGNNIKEDPELLKGIIDSGVVGLEAISSYHTESQTKYYIAQAEKNHLLITCGSDFHGKTKPAIELATFKVDFDESKLFQELIQYKN